VDIGRSSLQQLDCIGMMEKQKEGGVTFVVLGLGWVSDFLSPVV